MKRTPKKLTLSKETLRTNVLAAATGGQEPDSHILTCNCAEPPDLKAERVQ